MKAHLVIVDGPLTQLLTREPLCGAHVPTRLALPGWVTDVKSAKEQMEGFRGLCRKCLKIFLERPSSESREWVYAITEGDPKND